MYTTNKFEATEELKQQFSIYGGDGSFIMASTELAELYGVDVSFFLGLIKSLMFCDAYACQQNDWWLQIRAELIYKKMGKSRFLIKQIIKTCVNSGLLQFESGEKQGRPSFFRLTPVDELQNCANLTSREGGSKSLTPPLKQCGNNRQNDSAMGYRTCDRQPQKNYSSINARVHAHATKVLNTIKKNINKVEHKKNTPKHHTVSVRETQFTEMFYEQVAQNFPKQKDIYCQKENIENGAIFFHKLVKKYKGDFVYVSSVLEWALQDSFWKNQVRSIPALFKKSSKTLETKFENIAAQYEAENRPDKVITETDIIENYAKTKDYSDNETEQAINDYWIFKSHLRKINNSPDWIDNVKKLELVILWFLRIRANYYNPASHSIHGFDHVCEALRQYIWHLDRIKSQGQIKEIYPGMFSNESALFRDFVKYHEQAMGYTFFH